MPQANEDFTEIVDHINGEIQLIEEAQANDLEEEMKLDEQLNDLIDMSMSPAQSQSGLEQTSEKNNSYTMESSRKMSIDDYRFIPNGEILDCKKIY